MEGAAAPRPRGRAGRGGRHSCGDVGVRGDRTQRAGTAHGVRETGRDRGTTSSRRYGGVECTSDGQPDRRGGSVAARVARRALPRRLSAREADVEGAAYRALNALHRTDATISRTEITKDSKLGRSLLIAAMATKP